MMSRFVKIALAVSLVFNLSVLVAAGVFYFQKSSYWVSPFGVKMPRDRFLFEELSLGADQIKTMRANATRFHAEIAKKRMEIAAKRNDLFRLLRADVPDGASIHASLAEISRIQEELERMIAAHILQQKAVLNPQQQKKFFDLIQNAVTQRRLGNVPANCD